MAITTIVQKLLGGMPVSQHAGPWTVISNHGAGTIVTQRPDGSGGRTQVTAH